MVEKEREPAKEKLLLNQVAIVTGAAQGIGRAIAIEMAKEGADIVVADINEEKAKDIGRQIEALKRKALVIHCDVSRESDLKRLVRQTTKRFGKIDILVNNVGIPSGPGFLARSFEEWEKVMRTNLIGPGELTRRVIHEMIARKTKGEIIFISSIHQDIIEGNPLYSTSKAAVGMLVKELGLLYARKGIRVVGIAPGAIRTSWAIEMEKNDPETYKKIIEKMPMGRLGEPEEVAQLAVFLASEKASYISGTTVTIDGALSKYMWMSEFPWFGKDNN